MTTKISARTKKDWKRRLRAWLPFPSSRSVQRICERLGDEIASPWIALQLQRPYPPIEFNEPLGAYGERLASEFLTRSRFFVLERSFRTTGGEIDLIAVWKGREVVFVEVKTWLHPAINDGGPSDRVDDRKMKNITHTALRYLKQHHLLGTKSRFDVIEVILEPAGQSKPSFRHFENAFEATGNYQMFS